MQSPLGNKWLKLRYFILVAVVLALLGVLITFLFIFAKSNYVLRTVADKYDILVDLLVILLASGSLLIAAIGYGVYRVLSERIERKALAAARTEWHYWAAHVLIGNGLASWKRYQSTRQLLDLEIAIAATEGAYNRHGMYLDEREPEHERLIGSMLNNLGYYLAERCKSEDRERARQCAQYLQKRILKFPDASASWGDTINFIFGKYP